VWRRPLIFLLDDIGGVLLANEAKLVFHEDVVMRYALMSRVVQIVEAFNCETVHA